MQKHSNWRIRFVSTIVILLMFLLIGSAYRLQVQYNHKYTLISDQNRIRITPIQPKRGRIITSDGKVIASNIHKYKLILTNCSDTSFAENMDFLQKNITLTDQETSNILEMRRNKAAFTVIKDDLSWDEYSKIAINLFKPNQLIIEHSYNREYFNAEQFSHITGYTAKSNDSLRMPIGKTGVESFFDEQLVGVPGHKQTEVNAAGKTMRTLEVTDPEDGEDLHLTIDSELQKFVFELMSEQKAGGCVVLDMSGHVISLVSIPGFDTNLLSGRMTTAQWNDLRNDVFFPMINRVTNCTYPPGSVFKVAVAFAALSEGIVTPQDKIYCGGGVKQDNHVFHCWNRGGHGYVNLHDALRHSCDCYFFEVAKKLGIDTIVKYAEKLGFGNKTGIEISNEASGLLPTKQWKFLKYKTHWRPYETMIAGIGQGAVLTTLIQTATMFGKLYTNNFNFAPTLLKKENHVKVDPINSNISNAIKQGLSAVCTTGTAAGSCKAKYGIAGKTGSSQVRKLRRNEVGIHQNNFEWKYRDHAFFVGVAPLPDVKYIVAVFVEHGGGGASVAAPIARKIFDKLMKTK